MVVIGEKINRLYIGDRLNRWRIDKSIVFRNRKIRNDLIDIDKTLNIIEIQETNIWEELEKYPIVFLCFFPRRQREKFLQFCNSELP